MKTSEVSDSGKANKGTPNVYRNPKLLPCLIRKLSACDAASIGRHIHRIGRDNITNTEDDAVANAIVTHWPSEEAKYLTPQMAGRFRLALIPYGVHSFANRGGVYVEKPRRVRVHDEVVCREAMIEEPKAYFALANLPDFFQVGLPFFLRLNRRGFSSSSEFAPPRSHFEILNG